MSAAEISTATAATLRYDKPKHQRKRCTYCSRLASRLCDFGHAGGPCNARLCGQCAVTLADDRHHCRAHSLRGEIEVSA